ncbi:hypothetical protein Tco_1543991, partial [Tanacetum coccineum]
IIMANLPPPNHVADLPEDDQEEQLISMDKSKITRKQSKASKPRHENQKSTRPKPKPKTLAIHKDHSCISRKCPHIDPTATIDDQMIEEMNGRD